MTDHMPSWGNGRHEFREPFDRKKPVVEELEEGPEFPESLDFGDEREQLMVWETYQQLGKISFRLKYTNAKEETTSRTVTPMALTINNGNWGFFAVCELRNTVRWFRFDRVECIDPLPAVRHLTQWEASARLLVLAPHERQSILDALEILDPVMYKKLKRDYKRPEPKKQEKKAATNSDGYTWIGWARVAQVSVADGGTIELREAWRAAKDPVLFQPVGVKKPRESYRDSSELNLGGLTWREWMNAAGYPYAVSKPAHRVRREAWKRGEDPTEYRVAEENARRKLLCNSEGLTWSEWAHTAGVSRTRYTKKERQGWLDNVDPVWFRDKASNRMTLQERMQDEQSKRGSLTNKSQREGGSQRVGDACNYCGWQMVIPTSCANPRCTR